jgi:hypothetical protein
LQRTRWWDGHFVEPRWRWLWRPPPRVRRSCFTYIATRADSWKGKYIRLNPSVALNVTIPKRIPFMPWIKIPAATIALHGTARVIVAKDADAEIIQALMRGMVEDPELVAQTCVIEVEPTGHFVTYGVRVPLLAMRDPKTARGRVPVS